MTPGPATGRASGAALLPYAGLILGGLLIGLLPWFGPPNYIISLASSVAVLAVAGSGLGFLWGQSGQLSVAHSALLGMGAYTAAIAAKFFGFGFLAALPFAVLVGAVSGALIALPSLRTKGHYFVILTFAVGEVVGVFFRRLDWLTGGLEGLMTLPGTQTLFGLRLGNRGEYFALIVIFAVAMLMLLLFIMRSRWGTTLRGIRENPDLAASLGVNVVVNRILAFAVSGAVMGLAGLLYTYQVRFIDPRQFSANQSIILLMIVLLGGKAYLLGPAVGAAFYYFVQQFLGLPPVVNLIGFGIVLVVMILIAPNGILGLGSKLVTRKRASDADPAAGRDDLPAKSAGLQAQR